MSSRLVRAGLMLGAMRQSAAFLFGGRSLVASARASKMVVAMNLWGGLTAKREINYESLSGLAKEAGEYAVRGEIPNTSKDGLSMGVFAGGCFWGLELAYQRVPGVVETCVGYSQGTVEKPTYDEVCSATTGHTEAVMVTYDPEVVSFDALCDVFWSRLGGDAVRYHQVGNDRGPQYRHGIYTNTPEQLDVARKSLVERQKSFNRKITTEVEPVGVFWPAENYHQQYLEKGGRFNSPQSAEKGATDPIRCYG